MAFRHNEMDFRHNAAIWNHKMCYPATSPWFHVSFPFRSTSHMWLPLRYSALHTPERTDPRGLTQGTRHKVYSQGPMGRNEACYKRL